MFISQVVYRDGKKEILSRDQLFVRQLTPEQQKAHRPASWGIRTCFGGESSSDPVFY
ncbi:hypothetical protein D915_000589 [Fasciola hepatica]|uniref:Uncharacterized protein n=1 Tax=Fasciola hepatica TaxID=6192 RepID=A0A4E0RNN0_FASHE|nr:hypothetical protein D915_000589 [Fasciola hepatica]